MLDRVIYYMDGVEMLQVYNLVMGTEVDYYRVDNWVHIRVDNCVQIREDNGVQKMVDKGTWSGGVLGKKEMVMFGMNYFFTLPLM